MKMALPQTDCAITPSRTLRTTLITQVDLCVLLSQKLLRFALDIFAERLNRLTHPLKSLLIAI